MKHKHYDKIVAKSENMELVVFERQHTATHDKELFKELAPDGNKAIWFHESCDYFLCLPKHKEAVLNSLNGGIAHFESPREKGDHALEKADWSSSEWYMQVDVTSRIKPKKEYVWVAYHKDGFMFDEVGVGEQDIHHRVKEHELSDFNSKDWQYKEIEVEV